MVRKQEDFVMRILFREGNRGFFDMRKCDIVFFQVIENSINKMVDGEYFVCFLEKCEKEDIKQYIIECLIFFKFSVL